MAAGSEKITFLKIDRLPGYLSSMHFRGVSSTGNSNLQKKNSRTAKSPSPKKGMHNSLQV
jgi:hypothetical protein